MLLNVSLADPKMATSTSATSRPKPSMKPSVIPAVLVLISSSLVYLPSLNGRFVFDDFPAIVRNPDLSESSNFTQALSNIFSHDFWGESLTSGSSHKSYRPLTTLTFWFQKQIFEPGATFHFHLVNVLFHAVNCVLVFSIFRRFFHAEKSFMVAIIFSIHPVHVEPVAGIVGRADILYSTLVLAGILLSVKSSDGSFFSSLSLFLVISILCLASVLFKELGIALIPLVVLLEAFLKHRFKFLPLPSCAKPIILGFKISFYALAFIVIVLFRLYLVIFSPPTFQPGANPFAFVQPPLLKFDNLSYVYFVNFWILLAPDWLCFDWAFHCIRPIQDFSDVRIAFAVLLFALILSVSLVSVRRNDSNVLIFLALMIVPFLPASNLVFTVGFVIAERNLYLSVLGFAGLVIAGWQRILRTQPRSRRAFFRFWFALTLLCFAAKTWVRSLDWRSEHQLYFSGLKVCPNNAKVYYNIAKLSADSAAESPDKEVIQFNRMKAVTHYQQALKLWPNYEQALNNLGNLFRQLGNNYEAKNLLRRALEIQPKFPACWMNLGVVQANLNEFEEAELSYSTALSQRKNYPDCHYNLGTLFLKTKSLDRAIEHFSAAIHLRPTHFSAWSNLVMLLDNLERYAEAKAKAESAVKIFPDKSEFYFHLANLFGKTDLYPEAEAMYEKAIEKDPSKAIHFVNLGVLYHRWKKFDKAAESYRKAISLDPQNQSAISNLKRLRPKE